MTIGTIGLFLAVIIAYGELRYHWGRKDERRDNAVSAAQWVRRNHDLS